METLTVRAAGRSDIGLQRANNEDAFVVEPPLLLVADGVGGAAAGEIASGIVADTFGSADTVGGLRPEQVLSELIERGSDRIRDNIRRHPERAGMSTTVTAAWIGNREITVAQVGDSRAYRLSTDGLLTQLTRDDSFVQDLLDSGKITAQQAAQHPRRNVIVKAVDGSAVEPSYSSYEMLPGDRFLLCSDGLSDYVDPDVIADALHRASDPQTAVATLIDASYQADAPDNVTAIVAMVTA